MNVLFTTDKKISPNLSLLPLSSERSFEWISKSLPTFVKIAVTSSSGIILFDLIGCS